MPRHNTPPVVTLAAFALALVLLGLIACSKKESDTPAEAPPPAAQRPLDPAVAKAMDEIVEYRMRAEKDPKDVDAMAALGNANLALKRFDHAQDWYQRALEVDPNLSEVRMNLAIALRFQGKTDDAIAELDRLLAKDPKDAGALYNLGVILLEDKHDRQKAIAKWEALMKAHPDYPHATELRQVVESLKQAPAAPLTPGG